MHYVRKIEQDKRDIRSKTYSSSAVEVLPDSDRFKCRFKVKSASSNQLYLISYDSAAGGHVLAEEIFVMVNVNI